MITVTVTVEDYIAAHRLDYQRARKNSYFIFTAVLTLGIVLTFVGVKIGSLIAIFAGIGGLLGQWWEDYFGLPKKVRKLYKQFKGISEPHTLSWDSQHIEGQCASGHGKRNWCDYVRFKESDEVFLIYVTDVLWHVYPKRWFTIPGQLEEFRRYAGTAGCCDRPTTR